MPHTPTAAQQTQLATLKATLATAETNCATAKSLYTGNVAAVVNAQIAVDAYQAYVYGLTKARPGALDEGSATLV